MFKLQLKNYPKKKYNNNSVPISSHFEILNAAIDWDLVLSNDSTICPSQYELTKVK